MQLTPQLLIQAYCQGLFPMADKDGTVGWYHCDPRAVLPLETFRMPRRLARTVRSAPFEIRIDTAFRQVMEGCATLAPGRNDTWISAELIDAFTDLHRLGFAHSVECWRGGRLVGGVYGVAIRALFCGESMFHTARDASKVALVHLVERLRAGGYRLFDTQFVVSDFLRQFGVVEIPQEEYLRRLALALQVETAF
jgi:leucyl/phenylalanyl-tRNA--protein transferase